MSEPGTQSAVRPPAESSAPPAGTVAGERHVSEVAGPPSRISRKGGIGVIIGAAALACGFILLRHAAAEPGVKLGAEKALEVRQIARFEAPPALPDADPVAVLPPDQPPPLPEEPLSPTFAAGNSAPTPAPSPARTIAARVNERLVVYSASANDGQGAPSQGTPQLASDGGALGARLQATPLGRMSASLLPNQPYLLTTGTVIPCILQTAMDSTLPGFVTCIIPQDVLGKTGMTLLDRGTRIVGEFQGGVREGQGRLFVLWTRAETPQGVVISLGSPASDPLGRSGLAGAVDTHFWQRFGGALLLTTIDGAIQAGVAAASEDGTTTINTGAAGSVLAETLRGTINIPPTIRKAQGELVSVFVARDLDFSSVYGIQSVTAGGAGRP